MVTVEADPVHVESRLAADDRLPDVWGRCAGRLGYARARQIEGLGGPLRPRQARCRACTITHVLLPVTVLLRRAYAAERIWAALTARAQGAGHRRIGASLGVPAATVRGWLRRAGSRLETVRVWFLGVAVAAGVDVRIPDGTGCAWRDVLAAVATATAAIRFRFGAAGLLGAVTPDRVDQRIAVRYAIAGMGGADTADYIRHHCKIAGRADTLFSEDAIGLIHNASRGHPRAVNNLALHALTAAFAADHAIVDEKAARIAIAETPAD